MSAGNRKNQYRVPSRPVDKKNDGAVFVVVLMILAIVGIILGALVPMASAAEFDTKHGTFVQQVDSDKKTADRRKDAANRKNTEQRRDAENRRG